MMRRGSSTGSANSNQGSVDDVAVLASRFWPEPSSSPAPSPAANRSTEAALPIALSTPPESKKNITSRGTMSKNRRPASSRNLHLHEKPQSVHQLIFKADGRTRAAEIMRTAYWYEGLGAQRRPWVALIALALIVIFTFGIHSVPLGARTSVLWKRTALERNPHVWSDAGAEKHTFALEAKFYRMGGIKGLECTLSDADILHSLKRLERVFAQASISFSTNATFALQVQRDSKYQSAYNGYRASRQGDTPSWKKFSKSFVGRTRTSWEQRNVIAIVCVGSSFRGKARSGYLPLGPRFVASKHDNILLVRSSYVRKTKITSVFSFSLIQAVAVRLSLPLISPSHPDCVPSAKMKIIRASCSFRCNDLDAPSCVFSDSYKRKNSFAREALNGAPFFTLQEVSALRRAAQMIDYPPQPAYRGSLSIGQRTDRLPMRDDGILEKVPGGKLSALELSRLTATSQDARMLVQYPASPFEGTVVKVRFVPVRKFNPKDSVYVLVLRQREAPKHGYKILARRRIRKKPYKGSLRHIEVDLRPQSSRRRLPPIQIAEGDFLALSSESPLGLGVVAKDGGKFTFADKFAFKRGKEFRTINDTALLLSFDVEPTDPDLRLALALKQQHIENVAAGSAP